MARTWGHIWLVGLVVATGCDDIDLGQVLKPPQTLIRQDGEPAGLNCPLGGRKVRAGPDLDGDGTLAESEAEATEYVCDSTIPGMLVRVLQLLPGEPCPYGGQRFQAGHDLNGNDMLEDTEVLREVHGCSEPETVTTRVRTALPEEVSCEAGGSAVEAGADLNRNGTLEDSERQALLFICVEPAGVLTRQLEIATPSPICPAGSTRVFAGEDLNLDGVLDGDEILRDMWVCWPLKTFDGTYTVRDGADLAALQGISRIRGSLEVAATSLSELSLPNLMMVEGSIFIQDNPDLTGVSLRQLRFVAGDLNITGNASLQVLHVGDPRGGPVKLDSDLTVARNGRLVTLAGLDAVVPGRGLNIIDNALLRVGGAFSYVHALPGDITLLDNPQLQAPPFVNLKRLGGTLTITNNSALTSLEGPPLESIGRDLVIHRNGGLTTQLGLGTLKSVEGSLDIQANASLRSLGPGLRSLTYVGAISIVDNPSLDEIYGVSLPLRSVGALYIGGNESLRSLDVFMNVQAANSVVLIGNPSLGSLYGLRRLRSVGSLQVHDNDTLLTLAGMDELREVRELRVSFNGKLSALGMNQLTRVKDAFSIVENPSLPTCLATALAAKTFWQPPDISRNDDTATCD
ncbi:DUF7151 family protein [Pyxidicoccus xibeiensis]|uniref:DUF7151 family protein n=1 Tax=Pyxidicoccus xibeiensis TaxID=2906759 RepID=UPI0020A72678|nr:hypothetical protein [Pyxidicoccus xibeiensis]MCP3139532.1 hypothetical protein [Pyxidicoccus xibeiensis]